MRPGNGVGRIDNSEGEKDTLSFFSSLNVFTQGFFFPFPLLQSHVHVVYFKHSQIVVTEFLLGLSPVQKSLCPAVLKVAARKRPLSPFSLHSSTLFKSDDLSNTVWEGRTVTRD